MSEPKFTPGPWECGLERMEEPDKRLIWAVSLQVASTKSIWISQEIQEANALLISAAPDMYAALKVAITVIDSFWPHDPLENESQSFEEAAIARVKRMVREALSKAVPK